MSDPTKTRNESVADGESERLKLNHLRANRSLGRETNFFGG